jgi:hypothetical protein
MLNIIVKLEEPLTILKTSSGSSPGEDMSNHVIKSLYISHETVPLRSVSKQFIIVIYKIAND